jgi:hypothetical protein
VSTLPIVAAGEIPEATMRRWRDEIDETLVHFEQDERTDADLDARLVIDRLLAEIPEETS